MDDCEHGDYMRQKYRDFPMGEGFCGNLAPHYPHDACLGIICDYGCNEDGSFYVGLVVMD